MFKKAAICTVITASLIGGALTGCSPKGEKANSNGSGSSETSELSSKYAYKPEYVDLKGENKVDNVYGFVGNGEDVIFVGEKVIKEEVVKDSEGGEYTETETQKEVFKLDTNSKEITSLGEYASTEIPEGYEGESYIQNIFKGEGDTFWSYENAYTYKYNLPEGVTRESENAWEYYEEGGNVSAFRQFDFSGKELASVDITDIGFENGISSVQMDSKGNIYMSSWGEGIKILNPDGSLKKEIPSDERADGELYKIGADEIGMIKYSDDYSTRTLNLIDPETGSFGREIELPQRGYNLMEGFGDYQLLYNYNGKIYGHTEGSDEDEKLLDWFDYDINGDYVNKFEFLEGGRVVGFINDWSGDEPQPQLIIMNPIDAKDVVQKEEIVLAGLWMDYEIKNQAIKFNKSNDKYRIVMKDYSEFNKNDDYTLGLTKLNTEIISGQIPDILLTSELPIEMYAAKGVLADMWEFIDNDKSLSRSDLMEHVFDVMSREGKLYQIASSYSIFTAVANKDVWGNETASVRNLIEISKDLPEGRTVFGRYMGGNDLLRYVIYMNMDKLVDWETGKCSFDTPEFVEMLEFVNQFPREINWDDYEYEDENTLLLNGGQLLSIASIYSLNDFMQRDAILGDKLVYVGTPGMESGTTAVYPGTGLAITASCKNKDAAWEFVRTFLTEEYQEQNSWSFPTNKKAFDKAVEAAMKAETDNEGNPLAKTYVYNGDNDIPIYEMTEDQYNRFMELYNSIETVVKFDESMSGIISDEIEGFFNGQTSAEETARLIQSRVSLYVSEQK